MFKIRIQGSILKYFSSSLVLLVLVICSVVSDGPSKPTSRYDPYHHEVLLGPERNYTLEWRVDWKTRSIHFNVSAECKGYVGLGLSKRGDISGSDFAVGGVDLSGISYISDMHGLDDGTLERDYQEDWALIGANRSNGRTYLSFSRKFDTCDDDDEEDIPINNDLIYLIWIYGDTDEVTLFSPHLGKYPVYLLDPDTSDEQALHYYRQIGPHSNLYLMQRWRVSTRQRLLPRSNFQTCSVVKGLPLGLRHFILGGGAYTPHEAKDHVRQIILSRCVPPLGVNASTLFEPFVRDNGEECTSQNSPTIPRQFCAEKMFIWAQGGRPFYFPEDHGVPIGDSMEEYFMLEIQYENSELITDLEVKAGFDLMIHPRPLFNQVGIMTIGYRSDAQFVIPPRSPAFSLYGHCSPQCLRNSFPEGLSVFAALAQMRSTGTGVRIRQFQSGNELPWMLKDDNYDSAFQQIRMLPKAANISVGDQLTVQCTYDSSNQSNGTYAGISNGNEQCVAYLFVNQPVQTPVCSSSYSSDLLLSRLGVQGFTRSLATPKKTSAANSFSSSIEKSVQWSSKVANDLQREMVFSSQTSFCPSNIAGQQPTQPIGSRNPTARPNGRSRPLATNFVNTFPSGNAGSVALPKILEEYNPLDDCIASEDIPGTLQDNIINRNKRTTLTVTSTTSTTSTTPATSSRFRSRNKWNHRNGNTRYSPPRDYISRFSRGKV